MKRNVVAIIALAAVVSAASGCGSRSGETESIVVASAPFESLGLVYVAQDQDLFAANGLQVRFREFDTGAEALDSVVSGEADIAVGTAEFPLVGKAFQEVPISAIATIDRPEIIYLIGRKDRGIQAPSDLKGKRVGTAEGTIAQFYLGRFLELNGMTAEDIVFVNVKTPEEWRAAITNGDVDAVVLAQPEASTVRESLGTNATVLSVQAGQRAFTLAIATNAWIDVNPRLAQKFLTALATSEEFVAENPAKAKAIIQDRLGLDSSYMEAAWAQNSFALSLEQSLIVAMEDEARWMIRSKLTTETRIPDMGEYVNAGGLSEVKPEAVSILR